LRACSKSHPALINSLAAPKGKRWTFPIAATIQTGAAVVVPWKEADTNSQTASSLISFA